MKIVIALLSFSIYFVSSRNGENEFVRNELIRKRITSDYLESEYNEYNIIICDLVLLDCTFGDALFSGGSYAVFLFTFTRVSDPIYIQEFPSLYFIEENGEINASEIIKWKNYTKTEESFFFDDAGLGNVCGPTKSSQFCTFYSFEVLDSWYDYTPENFVGEMRLESNIILINSSKPSYRYLPSYYHDCSLCKDERQLQLDVVFDKMNYHTYSSCIRIKQSSFLLNENETETFKLKSAIIKGNGPNNPSGFSSFYFSHRSKFANGSFISMNSVVGISNCVSETSDIYLINPVRSGTIQCENRCDDRNNLRIFVSNSENDDNGWVDYTHWNEKLNVFFARGGTYDFIVSIDRSSFPTAILPCKSETVDVQFSDIDNDGELDKVITDINLALYDLVGGVLYPKPEYTEVYELARCGSNTCFGTKISFDSHFGEFISFFSLGTKKFLKVRIKEIVLMISQQFEIGNEYWIVENYYLSEEFLGDSSKEVCSRYTCVPWYIIFLTILISVVGGCFYVFMCISVGVFYVLIVVVFVKYGNFITHWIEEKTGRRNVSEGETTPLNIQRNFEPDRFCIKEYMTRLKRVCGDLQRERKKLLEEKGINQVKLEKLRERNSVLYIHNQRNIQAQKNQKRKLYRSYKAKVSSLEKKKKREIERKRKEFERMKELNKLQLEKNERETEFKRKELEIMKQEQAKNEEIEILKLEMDSSRIQEYLKKLEIEKVLRMNPSKFYRERKNLGFHQKIHEETFTDSGRVKEYKTLLQEKTEKNIDIFFETIIYQRKKDKVIDEFLKGIEEKYSEEWMKVKRELKVFDPPALERANESEMSFGLTENAIRFVNGLIKEVFIFFGGKQTPKIERSCRELIAVRKYNLVKLGEFKNRGVCRHRGILFKVVCDLLGIPCFLQRGWYGVKKPERAHVWNVLQLKKWFFPVDTSNFSELFPKGHRIDMKSYLCDGENNFEEFPELVKNIELNYRQEESNDLGGGVFSRVHAVKARTPTELEEENEGEEEEEDGCAFKEKKFAVKMYDSRILEEYVIKREEFALRLLNHPNIVKFFGSFSHGKSFHEHHGKEVEYFYLCMEYLNKSGVAFQTEICSDINKKKGDLSMLSKEKKFAEVLIFFIEILNGLKYLHDMDMIHFDLHLGNICVNLDGEKGILKNVKIIDLGSVKSEYGINTTVPHCNKEYMAPEVLKILLNEDKSSNSGDRERKDRIFTKKSDIYSFGVLMLKFNEIYEGFGEIEKKQMQCVKENPGERPSIWELILVFETFLKDSDKDSWERNRRMNQINFLQKEIEKLEEKRNEFFKTKK